ncbi:uncharacterized protein KY384_000788 [Bacidia gigantensis]|uniref:uncharacterized protein n=1 Tax=Bacidia gigantensis TaxID=2732470 RepID=UPI001D050FF1|nr:uncharacterized protein KY384_000788 [Bacidia gigantensis]KAG8526026.1 hypothetical protein KY384_000788 [Bacidia gigantensis]
METPLMPPLNSQSDYPDYLVPVSEPRMGFKFGSNLQQHVQVSEATDLVERFAAGLETCSSSYLNHAVSAKGIAYDRGCIVILVRPKRGEIVEKFTYDTVVQALHGYAQWLHERREETITRARVNIWVTEYEVMGPQLVYYGSMGFFDTPTRGGTVDAGSLLSVE